MSPSLVVLPILFPLITGALLPLFRFRERKYRNIYVELVTLINSVMILILLYHHPGIAYRAINLAGNLEVTFKIDGLSCLFAGLIAF